MDQDTWRQCKKCRVLFYCGRSRGVCAMGGPHDPTMTRQYTLTLQPGPSGILGESGWRWCHKCEGLFMYERHEGTYDSPACPAGDHHDAARSGNYFVSPGAGGLSSGAMLDTSNPTGDAGRSISMTEHHWFGCGSCGGLFTLADLDETASPVGACPGQGGGPHVRRDPRDRWVRVNAMGFTTLRSENSEATNSNYPWQNWGATIYQDDATILRPRSLDQVISIVQAAVNGAMTVRAVGSSWSFAGTVKPDRGQYVLETKDLNAEIVSVTSRISPHSPYFGRLYHVEAGVKIHHLYARLAARGLALSTQGGSGGQSIAGVMATGTHGGDIDLPPIADGVRAMHLVGPDGSHYWIERKDRPITTQELVEAALPFIDPNNILYDNDLFDAVLVSFGAMGVIYSVVLEARTAFQLEEVTRAMPWTEVKRQITSGEIYNRVDATGTVYSSTAGNTDRTRYLEIVMAPNSASDGSRMCYVSTRSEVDPAQNIVSNFPPNDPGILGYLCQWDLRVVIGAVITVLPLAITTVAGTAGVATVATAAIPGLEWTGPVLAGLVATAQAVSIATLTAALTALQIQCGSLMECATALADMLDPVGLLWLLRDQNAALIAMGRKVGAKQGPSWWIMDTFDYTNPNCMEVDSLEAFFPADNGSALAGNLQMLMDAIDTAGTALGYLSLRFTGPTTAMLGMQQGPDVPGGAQMTCSAELTIIKGLPKNGAVMDAAQQVTLNGGGRLHWGQRNEWMVNSRFLNLLDVEYPRFGTWKRIRRQLESSPNAPNGRYGTFDNDFIRALLRIAP